MRIRGLVTSLIVSSLCFCGVGKASGQVTDEALFSESISSERIFGSQNTEESPISAFGSRNVLEFELRASVDRLILLQNSLPALSADLVLARSDLEKVLRIYQDRAYDDADRTLVLAAFHALGDSWIYVTGFADYASAWAIYVDALDWLAGMPDSAWAGRAFVGIFTRSFESRDYLSRVSDVEQVTAMGQPWISYLRDLIPYDNRSFTPYYILALYNHYNSRASAAEKLRVRETYELAFESDSDIPWYETGKFHYALWLQQVGNATLDGKGALSVEPDLPAAVGVFRELRDSTALNPDQMTTVTASLTDLEHPDVALNVAQVYLPSADIDIELEWRNILQGSLRVFEVDPETGIDFTGLPEDATIADAVVVSPTSALLEIPVSRDETDNAFNYEFKNLQLPLALELGLYLVELETDSDFVARTLLWVSDLAQINSLSANQQTLSLINAETGEAVDDTFSITRWIWDTEREAWYRETTNMPESSSTLRLAHTSRASVIWTFAFRGNRISASRAAMETQSDANSLSSWALVDRSFLGYGETFDVFYQVSPKADEAAKLLKYAVVDASSGLISEGLIDLAEGARGSVSCTISDSNVAGPVYWELRDFETATLLKRQVIAQVAPTSLAKFTAEMELSNFADGPVREWVFMPGSTVDISGELSDASSGNPAEVLCLLRVFRAPLGLSATGSYGLSEVAPSSLMLYTSDELEHWEMVYSQQLTTNEFGQFRSLIPITDHLGDFDSRYQYWVNLSYSTPAAAQWVSAKWLSFVVSPSHYIPELKVNAQLVRPGESILLQFAARSPLKAPVMARGTLSVERKVWEELWIDSKGRQLTGEEYRQSLSRRGFFRAWSDNDTAYRLLESGYKSERMFSQRVQLGLDETFEQQFKLTAPGIYEISWVDIDASGRQVYQTETVYCLEPISGSTAGWNLEDFVWISPEEQNVEVNPNAGILLFPSKYERVWVALENAKEREMRVFEVDRGVLSLDQVTFPSLWDQAERIEIGVLDGTELRTFQYAFNESVALDPIGLRVSSPRVAPFENFEITSFANRVEGLTGDVLYALLPTWNESLDTNLEALDSELPSKRQEVSWDTSFDLKPYYFPLMGRVRQEDSGVDLDVSLAAERTHVLHPSAVGLTPGRFEWLHNIQSEFQMSLKAPEESSEYKIGLIRFDGSGQLLHASADFTVRSNLEIEGLLPQWSRVGDRVVSISTIQNNSDSHKLETFETSFLMDDEILSKSVNNLDLEVGEMRNLRTFFDVAELQSYRPTSAQVQLKNKEGRLLRETEMEVLPKASGLLNFISMNPLQDGLWKISDIDISKIQSLYFIFSSKDFYPMMSQLGHPDQPEFLLPVLRNLLLGLNTEIKTPAITSELSKKLATYFKEDGGVSIYHGASTDRFWSAFVYLLQHVLENKYSELTVSSTLEDYLLRSVTSDSLRASERVWLLYALSARFHDGLSTATRSELEAYQRLWRVRASLPPYLLYMLATVSERFGLEEDQEFWLQLANRRETTERERMVSEGRLLNLVSNASPFFSSFEEAFIQNFEKTASLPIGIALDHSIPGDGLSRDFLLALLLGAGVETGLDLVEASVSTANIQVRVGDRILSRDEYNLEETTSGTFFIRLDPSVAMNFNENSITVAVGGAVLPKAIWAQVDGVYSSSKQLKVERVLHGVSRVKTLLRGVVESRERLDANDEVQMGLHDRLDAELVIRVDSDRHGVVFRESLPAGLSLVPSSARLRSRSGVELSPEGIVWKIDDYGIEAHIATLPAGQWTLEYRLNPQAEGTYYSGIFMIYASSPSFDIAQGDAYSVTIKSESEEEAGIAVLSSW